MGRGIAQVAAQCGFRAVMFDTQSVAIENALKATREGVEKLASKGKLSATDADRAKENLAAEPDLERAVRDAAFVVEAIPERIDLKLDLFGRLSKMTRPDALLGTNTSSLSVTEIAGATSDPSRVVGLHFFNPVPLMELLEIVQGMRTSDATIARARDFATKLQKKPIVVRDSPGFATSRLGVAIGAEAIRMLESGVASAEDIDTAMELGYRHPMGPLKLTDLVGLDVRLAILDHLHREVGEQFRAPSLLRQMVRAGKLGKKSGEGFYKY